MLISWPSWNLSFLTWPLSSSIFCDLPFHWLPSLVSSWMSTTSPISRSSSRVAFSMSYFCSWFSFLNLIILFSISFIRLSESPGDIVDEEIFVNSFTSFDGSTGDLFSFSF